MRTDQRHLVISSVLFRSAHLDVFLCYNLNLLSPTTLTKADCSRGLVRLRAVSSAAAKGFTSVAQAENTLVLPPTQTVECIIGGGPLKSCPVDILVGMQGFC